VTYEVSTLAVYQISRHFVRYGTLRYGVRRHVHSLESDRVFVATNQDASTYHFEHDWSPGIVKKHYHLSRTIDVACSADCCTGRLEEVWMAQQKSQRQKTRMPLPAGHRDLCFLALFPGNVGIGNVLSHGRSNVLTLSAFSTPQPCHLHGARIGAGYASRYVLPL